MDDVLQSASRDPKAYPLWMLFSVERLKEFGNFGESLPGFTNADGLSFVPVFTDKDIAQRFAKQSGGLELLPIENLDRLCFILRLYQKKGVPYVGTDFFVAKGKKKAAGGQFRTISVFLAEIE